MLAHLWSETLWVELLLLLLLLWRIEWVILVLMLLLLLVVLLGLLIRVIAILIILVGTHFWSLRGSLLLLNFQNSIMIVIGGLSLFKLIKFSVLIVDLEKEAFHLGAGIVVLLLDSAVKVVEVVVDCLKRGALLLDRPSTTTSTTGAGAA